jgi:hypothetical protein
LQLLLCTGNKYNLPRTRDAVEDRTLRRLAGLEEYEPDDVRRATPLVDLSEQQLKQLLMQPA